MRFTKYLAYSVALLPVIVAGADSSSSHTAAVSTTASTTEAASSSTGSTNAASSSNAASPSSTTSKATSTASTISSSSTSDASSTSQSGTSSSTAASASSSSSSVPTLTTSSSSASSSDSDSMPSLTTDSSSSSTSSYSVTFTPTVPTGTNPEITIETLPAGLTFIAVGAVLGLLLAVLVLSRVVLSCMSRKAAKQTHVLMNGPDEHLDYDPSIFAKKHMANTSVYSLSSSSTLNVLGSQHSMDHLATSGGQGRSYRNAVTRASRSSLFISPTELLAMSNLPGGYLGTGNSPIDSPQTVYSNEFSSSQESPSTEKFPVQTRTRRPPSVYMEELLDGDLIDVESDNSTSSYDVNAHEKV